MKQCLCKERHLWSKNLAKGTIECTIEKFYFILLTLFIKISILAYVSFGYSMKLYMLKTYVDGQKIVQVANKHIYTIFLATLGYATLKKK